MIIRGTTRFSFTIACLIWAACGALFQSPVYAETYIGGQFGVTLPGSLSNGQVTTPGFGALTLSDQELRNSMMWGVKGGHYFSAVRWFGVETEFFYTTPHVKQQPLTFKGPGGAATIPTQGLHHRVMTWAPLNFMFRYPKTRLQPYVGIGPGIFFSRLKDGGTGDAQSSTRLGLNTQLGARYYLTRNVAFFGEWKYNYARFDYADQANLFGFKATYSAHILAFGATFHF